MLCTRCPCLFLHSSSSLAIAKLDKMQFPFPVNEDDAFGSLSEIAPVKNEIRQHDMPGRPTGLVTNSDSEVKRSCMPRLYCARGHFWIEVPRCWDNESGFHVDRL